MLPDGSYEGLVVDVDERDDTAATALSIVLVAGDHKGEVVDVLARGMHGDAVDLLGMPCVVTVIDGEPTVVMD